MTRHLCISVSWDELDKFNTDFGCPTVTEYDHRIISIFGPLLTENELIDIKNSKECIRLVPSTQPKTPRLFVEVEND